MYLDEWRASGARSHCRFYPALPGLGYVWPVGPPALSSSSGQRCSPIETFRLLAKIILRGAGSGKFLPRASRRYPALPDLGYVWPTGPPALSSSSSGQSSRSEMLAYRDVQAAYAKSFCAVLAQVNFFHALHSIGLVEWFVWPQADYAGEAQGEAALVAVGAH